MSRRPSKFARGDRVVGVNPNSSYYERVGFIYEDGGSGNRNDDVVEVAWTGDIGNSVVLARNLALESAIDQLGNLVSEKDLESTGRDFQPAPSQHHRR